MPLTKPTDWTGPPIDKDRQDFTIYSALKVEWSSPQPETGPWHAHEGE